MTQLSGEAVKLKRFVVRHECDEMMSQEELSRSLRGVLGQLKSRYGVYLGPPPLALLADPEYTAAALAWMKEEPSFFGDTLITLTEPGEGETLALRAFAARGGRRLALLTPPGPQSQRLAGTLRQPGFSARVFEPGSGVAAAEWLRAGADTAP